MFDRRSIFAELASGLRLPLRGDTAPGFRAAQLGAVHAICGHFWDKARPALVVMPTGAGKSAVMMASSILLRSTRVLVVAPSRLLRDQLTQNFAEWKDLRTVGAIDGRAPKPRVHEVTSKLSTKKAWAALRKADVVIGTPASLSPGVDGVFVPPTDLFDTILFDEAHHVPAKSYSAIAESFPGARQILFTAVATSGAALVSGVDSAGMGHTGVGPSTTPFEKQEPSADFIDDRTLAVGFNISGDQGWAISHDLGHTFPLQCSFGGTNLSGGGGACPPVPPPPGGTLPWQWSGDPVLRADGHGNLVYISLGDPTTDQDAAHFIVAAVSSNGGASFASSVLVNDVGCGSSGVSPAVDQPNATFDYTTDPPTLWVVYRFFAAGTQTFAGACVRRGVVDTTGTARVRWLDQARNVDGLGASGFGFPYTYGVSVAAGDGVVTIMSGAATSFLPVSNPKNPHGDPCPDDSPDFNGMAWATVDSFDNGQNWVDNTKIFHTDRVQWCVLEETPNTRGGSLPTVGKVLMGLRSFGIARAPGGIEYAVLQDTHTTARLFMSPAAGIKGSQNPNSTIRTWYEWCPGTPTSNVSAGPTSNWRSTGIGNGDVPPCATPAIQPLQGGNGAPPLDLVWPTLAADGRGNIAVTDIEDVENDPAGGQAVNYAVRGIINPQQPGAVLQGPTFIRATSFALPYSPTSPFDRPLGDYGWITVRPTGSGATFRPSGCSTPNDFYVAWTANDGADQSEIVARGFSITP